MEDEPAIVRGVVSAARRRRPGSVGEAAVSRRLRRCCAEVANDLILRDGRGELTQIDHLALTLDGVLVVETKDYGGLIFGQVHDRTWTQCIGRQRNKFQNPLRQNYGHIKAVEALVPKGRWQDMPWVAERALDGWKATHRRSAGDDHLGFEPVSDGDEEVGANPRKRAWV